MAICRAREDSLLGTASGEMADFRSALSRSKNLIVISDGRVLEMDAKHRPCSIWIGRFGTERRW
jgi:hypothetical protein